jgi:hypothetical protein
MFRAGMLKILLTTSASNASRSGSPVTAAIGPAGYRWSRVLVSRDGQESRRTSCSGIAASPLPRARPRTSPSPRPRPKRRPNHPSSLPASWLRRRRSRRPATQVHRNGARPPPTSCSRSPPAGRSWRSPPCSHSRGSKKASHRPGPEEGQPPAWPLALPPLGLYALWWIAKPRRGVRALLRCDLVSKARRAEHPLPVFVRRERRRASAFILSANLSWKRGLARRPPTVTISPPFGELANAAIRAVWVSARSFALIGVVPPRAMAPSPGSRQTGRCRAAANLRMVTGSISVSQR